MTHLRIEQNNIQENVSSAVIEKLYELATSGDLDASSHLAGNLYVPATYQEYIDVLTDQTDPKFRDLTITAGNIYIMFADPEVQRVLLANNIGDGIGVTVAQAALANLGTIFQNNTTAQTFNELYYFTGLTTIPMNAFNGCTSLTSVVLPNTCTQVNKAAFSGCSSLTTVRGLSNVTLFAQECFRQCTNLTTHDIDWSNVTTIQSAAFYGSGISGTLNLSNCTGTLGGQAFRDTNITSITSLGNITNLDGGVFWECSSLSSVNMSQTVEQLSDKCFYGCNLSSLDTSHIKRFRVDCLNGTHITTLDLSSMIYTTTNAFSGLYNLNITFPSSDWEHDPNGNSAWGASTFNTINGSFENYQYFHRDFPIFSSTASSIDVLYFKTATAIYGNISSGRGFCTKTNYSGYIRQLYLPALQSVGYYYSSSMKRIEGYLGTPCQQYYNESVRFKVGLIYMKDITELDLCFFGLDCDALVINNTTPPTIPTRQFDYIAVYSHNVTTPCNLDTWGNISNSSDPNAAVSSNSSTYNTQYYSQGKYAMTPNITAIYVPDSAVSTYKAASGWTSVASKIHGISELNNNTKYATKAAWEAAGKPVALIEECM